MCLPVLSKCFSADCAKYSSIYPMRYKPADKDLFIKNRKKLAALLPAASIAMYMMRVRRPLN